MKAFRFPNRFLLVGFVAAIVAAAAFPAARAWAGGCCSGNASGGCGCGHAVQGAACEHCEHDHAGMQPASIHTQPPHGGQIHATGVQSFEAVYLPKETRVYLYDHNQRPTSARGVQGSLTFQLKTTGRTYRYPLQYVAPRSGQDYLAVGVDVSQVRDGDMTATFALDNLPYQQELRASFTQTFALAAGGGSSPAAAKPQVRVVALDASDQAAIQRQGACPVSGGRLGSMGTPVKVLVGDTPVYLCCKGCVGKVRENPEKYVPARATAQQQAAQGASDGQLTVTKATAADEAAIRAQGTCAVRNTPLGGMGTPIKVTRGSQSLFLCCQGCVAKVEANPDYYFARAAKLVSGG